MKCSVLNITFAKLSLALNAGDAESLDCPDDCDMNRKKSFEQLIEEASSEDFSGWDFSYLDGRWDEEKPSWDYKAAVSDNLGVSMSLLDMGTGGGEFLSSLQPLPKIVYATEAYAPNVPIARKNLAPLGVEVIELNSDESLPFDDGYFDLVINRHEAFCASEVSRILKTGGKFITQQVGGKNNTQLNEFLIDDGSITDLEWTLDQAREQLEEAGFENFTQFEEFPRTRFYDIGAVIFYLRAISWQIPDFDIDKYESPLRRLHHNIEQNGVFETKAHSFFLLCTK